ncbi:MAG TPA: DNA repair protein RecO, partial [Burkholderiales bacterium]|nr:DNA repair protein RecO [Burkholderiales bacterium]
LYAYEPDRGPVAAHAAASGQLVVRGRTLLEVARDEYGRAETLEEARLLMRLLIGERLHGQALHTRAVLMELNEL